MPVLYISASGKNSRGTPEEENPEMIFFINCILLPDYFPAAGGGMRILSLKSPDLYPAGIQWIKFTK
jgi:hypothetical protein